MNDEDLRLTIREDKIKLPNQNYLFRICTTIYEKTAELVADVANKALQSGSDLIEIRIDYLKKNEIGKVKDSLSQNMSRCILTLRTMSEGGLFTGTTSEYSKLLSDLTDLRPAYLDVEIRMLEKIDLEKVRSCDLILSFHDLKQTPSVSTLTMLRDKASRLGIVKLITKKKCKEDEARLLSLYHDFKGKLVAFCMGKEGLHSRFRSITLGAPIAYVALENNRISEKLGQPTLQQMLIYRRSLLE